MDRKIPDTMDGVYELVRDLVVWDYLREMDMQFRAIHALSMKSGALVITKPREFKHGFWNRMKHLYNPNKTVMTISVCGEMLRCSFDPEYKEYAEKMGQLYQTEIVPRLCQW